jgi:hypothetical protein
VIRHHLGNAVQTQPILGSLPMARWRDETGVAVSQGSDRQSASNRVDARAGFES